MKKEINLFSKKINIWDKNGKIEKYLENYRKPKNNKKLILKKIV